MDKKEVNNQVLTIVQSIKNDKSIQEDSHLIHEGILSSLEILNLIGELESAFSVKIPIEEILPDNFDQVSSLGSMIARLIEN